MTQSKSVSERYQKISQLEHILKRPDTYIGSVETQESVQWIHDEATDCMIEKTVNIVPGLFKIFDEILVNAADNKVRDPSMKKIDVTINQEENLIEVRNDGKGIPVEIHEKEGIYIPEMIFGHLLTSSNYDDDEKKVTGGRNGYGAKLCNIFSTEFILETADPSKGQKYVQKWENNMSVCHPPSITSYKRGPSYTKVSFRADLQRFNMEKLDDDIVGVMRRRVYDINGSVRDVNVSLNGKPLKIKNFKNYVELYLKSLEKIKLNRLQELTNPDEPAQEPTNIPAILYEKINDRWEIAFAVSENSFQQISFVNSIATTSGGTHVNYVTDQIVKKVSDRLKKQKKSIKPFQIKNNMFIFINCLIENPAFTSQTKEQLTTRVKDFGSKCEVPNDFVNKVMKTDLATRIFDIADENAEKQLKKTDGSRKNRITEYPKLEDANKAGTKEGYKCTLVLTEGDSALSLAVAGLAVVGRDYYGCFPLRGKMLNVREATPDQITKNAEIQAIKKIMGLQHKKRYEDATSLRYGHIMIMTDQDHDGSHIKGLIINFLESSFPGLLDIPGFLIEFITPIIKITITRPKKQTISFYNMPDYEKWREEESHKYTWKQKYYKGLGTSTQQEAREYFSQLDLHLKKFHALQGDDCQLIDLAFSKKKADDRKEWLKLYEPGTVLDPKLTEIPISDFINKELILFSLADNIRSIPSVLDGLKPGQRKVIYACFKRNLKSEIKVAQLGGYVSEHTGYHHGEASLYQTIVGLAQDFVGSNNIYLLKPNGAFGTRATGGKDSAAPRYIFTELNKITRKIFNSLDDPLLTYIQDDEQTVEPEWYLPVIPMILVNGCEGIGTGWSTNIPPFNPVDIVNNVKRLLKGEEMEPMAPWYRGWKGSIEKIDTQKYRTYGRIEQIDECTLEITELPPKTWTCVIKEYLLLGLSGNDKVKPWIKDMQEQHGATIKFIVTLSPEEMEKTRKIGFYERFKLVSTVSLSNMVAFDPQGKIKKYDDVRDILSDFYYTRLEYYQKRKDYISERLKWEVDKLSFQVKFIKMIVEKELTVSNKPRPVLFKELESLGFPTFNKEGKPTYGKVSDIASIEEIKKDEDEDDDDDDEKEDPEESEDVVNGPEEKFGNYDYLLGMKIWSLTKERYEKLLEQMQEKQTELERLLKLSAKDLWNIDLDDFMAQYERFIELDEEIRNNIVPDAATKKKGKRTRRKDDDDYDPKKPKKRSRKTIKNDYSEFERVLIEPKIIEKVKRVPKIKTENNDITKKLSKASKSKQSTPEVVVPAETVPKKEPSSSSSSTTTIFSKPSNSASTKQENGEKDEFSVFSSKFKKLSSDFNANSEESLTSTSTVPSLSASASDATKTPPPAPAQNTASKSDDEDEEISLRKNKKPAKKPSSAQMVSLSDESDLEILENLPSQPRKRAARAAKAKPSAYSQDISDDSFLDDDDDANSDGSFHASE